MSFHIVVLFLESFLFTSSVAWDYQNNGADWTGLGQCGAGNAQSPIDVPNSITKAGDSTVFLKYPEIASPFQLYNNGYSLAFTLPETYKGGFGLGKDVGDFQKDEKDGASAYRLWQVNFHSPSEHSFDGKKMPLEMQLMHQRVTGGGPETAVISIFFADAANSYNDFLEGFARHLPESDWDEETVNPPSTPFASIVGGSPFYHYVGSLTVPPCETNVKYYLRQTPINAANAQLTKFASALAKTCPPKGNYRIAQPLTTSLMLVPSVDLVADPDGGAKAKPKVSSTAPKSIDPLDDKLPEPPKQEGGCGKDEYDDQFNKLGRIAVGDPDYVIAAKEAFLRAKRNIQAAEASYRMASMGYQTQKGLYDSAPGLVEKIHIKWALHNAKVLEANAKVTKDGLQGTLDEPWSALLNALNRMCRERRANVTVETAVVITTPKPLAKQDKPPWVYSEPLVKLPTGLSASPFTDGSSTSKTSGSSIGGRKIAPNLHQADVPASAKNKEAPPQATTVEDVKPAADQVLKISLPISHQSIVDEGKFKQDLLNTLATKAGISPSDLSVKGIQDRSVANVAPTAATLFQRKPQSQHNFLGSSRT